VSGSYSKAIAIAVGSAILAGCGGASAPNQPTVIRATRVAPDGPSLPAPTAVPEAPETEGLRTTTRPLASDVAQLAWAREARIAPDGRTAVYVAGARRWDADAQPSNEDTDGGWTRVGQLFVLDLASGASRQLTHGENAPYNPRWSPDGQSLVFARYDDGESRLFVLPMNGGEARPLDTGELQPYNVQWLPDGSGLAFIATPPRDADGVAARWRAGGAYRYDRDWRSAALYTLNLDRGASPAPAFADRHVVDYDIAPNGQQFAVVTAESSNPYHAWSLHQVAVVDRKSGKTTRVLQDKPSAVAALAWSPNGERVAVARGENTLSLINYLEVHDVASGKKTHATSDLDPSIASFSWADNDNLFVVLMERTRLELYRVGRTGGAAKLLLPRRERLFSRVHFDRAGRRGVAIASAPDAPAEVVSIDLPRGRRRGAVTVQTNLNPAAKAWSLSPTEVVRWKSKDGFELEGLLTVSTHGSATKPAPLLVLPHGGPDSVTSETWSSWTQYFAARGYSVFRPNYRGGFGYGYAAYAANRGRLGEIELMDIESGVDALVAAGKARAESLFYGGWSWGGYLTAWTIGHTKRYRAAVVGAGIVDVTTQYASSDINHEHVADWEFRGRPWRDPESFARSNPARHLGKIETPTLILHGERDDRVHFVNGQILYRALVDNGTEVEFFAYPREPHGFREGAHVVHMLSAWARWLDSHRGP